MPFKFENLSLPGVILIEPRVFEDERGFFLETYKKSDLKSAGINTEFVQDNHSRSERSVLRGLHFQKEPYAQAKIVRCTRGSIYDVAVDLREGFPTFGKYVDSILSEENKHQLYIPRGCAHGFLVLSDVAEVMYKADNVYAPECEGGLIWNDPDVNISWPDDNPILSQRDLNWPILADLVRDGDLF